MVTLIFFFFFSIQNNDNHNHNKTDMPVISTDDLLPLLIYVIIKSHPMHVYSNVFYINNFQINKITSNSDIG